VFEERSLRSSLGFGAVALVGAVVGASSALLLGDFGRRWLLPISVADGLALVTILGLVGTREWRAAVWKHAVAGVGRDDPNSDQPVVPLADRLQRQAEALRRVLRAHHAALLLATGGDRVAVVAAAGTGSFQVGAEVPGMAAFLRSGSAGLVPAPLQAIAPAGTRAMAGVPLRMDGAAAGIAVVSSQRRGFGPRRLRRLDRVARELAATVERIRVDDTERRSRLGAEHARRHVELIAVASGTFASSIESYRAAMEVLGTLIVPDYADWFAIDLVVDGSQTDRVVGLDADAGGPCPAPEGWGTVVREVLRMGQATLVTDTTPIPPDRHAVTHAVLREGLRLTSWVMVPIRSRGLSLGTFSVGTRAPRRGLRPSDVRVFEELATRCALLIERVLLFREARESAQTAERNVDQLRRAVQAARVISEPLSPSQVIALAARETATALGGSSARVRRYDPAGGHETAVWPPRELDGRAAADLDEAETGALQSHRPVWASPDRSSLAVLLTRPDGSTAGTLGLAGFGELLTTESQSVLMLLAHVTASAIVRAELYEATTAGARRLRTLVEASPVGIVELDVAGRAMAWNDAARTLLGGSGTADAELSEATTAALTGFQSQLLAGRPVVDVPVTIERPVGPPAEVLVAAAALADADGSVASFLYLMSDVTGRRQLELEVQQKRHMEALGRMAGGVAHDFNNLLTVIVGYADLVAHRLGPDHALTEDVDAIRSAGRRAASFTEQLLTISRHRVGQTTVVDLNAAVSELANILERLVREDVELVFELDPEAGRVRIDVGQLEQVVLNLVVNSRDAMPTGGRLTVATRTEPGVGRDPGHAVLVVSDTGVGMDHATRERCFEPFYTTNRRASSAGLGLATVYGIVTKADGRISIESAPGQGCSVFVALPRLTLEAEGETGGDNGAGVGAVPGAVVLLVEDQADVRTFAAKVLTSVGYTVYEAASGAHALRLARTIMPCDILVTDVVMPGMRGSELAERLEEQFPGVPVLFMSGYADDEASPLPLTEPGRTFLAKPFDRGQLLAAVGEALAAAQRSG